MYIVRNLFFGIGMLISFHITSHAMLREQLLLSKKSPEIGIIKHFKQTTIAKNKLLELDQTVYNLMVEDAISRKNRLILQDKVKKFNLKIDEACNFAKCPQEGLQEVCKKHAKWMLTTIKNDFDLTKQDTAANKAKQFARLYIYTKVSTTALKLLLNYALGNPHNNVAEDLYNEVITDCKGIVASLFMHLVQRSLVTNLSLWSDIYNNDRPHFASAPEEMLHDIQSDLGLRAPNNQNSYISALNTAVRLNLLDRLIFHSISYPLQEPFFKYINRQFAQLPSQPGPQFQETPSMLLGIILAPIYEELLFTYIGNDIITQFVGKEASRVIVPILFGLGHIASPDDPRTKIRVFASVTQSNALRTYYFQKYNNLMPCIFSHMLNNFWPIMVMKFRKEK